MLTPGIFQFKKPKTPTFITKAFVVVLALLLITPTVFAAPADLDLTFDAGTIRGPDGAITSASVQSNDKIIVGGGFEEYDGISRLGIARLNTDGLLDTTFDPGTGFDASIHALAIQSDDKILVGGQFTEYDGTLRNRIARLNTDGSLDLSFDPGDGFDSTVSSLVIQSDGKIIAGGSFTAYDGTPRIRIARLNTDGTLDMSFDPGDGFSGQVSSLIIQSDDKIMAGGSFTAYDGTPRIRIARLNTDGSLDGSFDPGDGFDSSVNSLSIQSDGKIVVGGQFIEYDGTPRIRIARLNTDGTLDGSFDPGDGFGVAPNYILIDDDDKIVAAGNFTAYDGTGRNRITRINTDGSLDLTFDIGTGFDN